MYIPYNVISALVCEDRTG